jgi:zinc-binding in reverse transcriptase
MEGEVRTIDILSSLSANFCGLDYVVWSLTSSGIYTVRSMYLFFMNTDFSNNTLLSLWDLKLPLKIKCFMLLVLHGKILTRSNLLHRGWGDLFLVHVVILFWKQLIIYSSTALVCMIFGIVLIYIIITLFKFL